MAVNEELDAYLRGLYGLQDQTRTVAYVPPMEKPYIIEEEAEPQLGPVFQPPPEAESAAMPQGAGPAMPARQPLAPSAAPQAGAAAPAPGMDMGYLDALTEAQRQDELTAGMRRLNDPMEQLAQIQSRGIYRPMGLGPIPSAVGQLAQRRAAVEDFLRQQREERGEARVEAREKRADAQVMADMARIEALQRAQELKDALAAGRQPFEIAKLKAETEAAANKAALYARQAEEIGNVPPARGAGAGRVAVAPKAVEPKPPSPKKLRELPAQQVEALSGIDVAVKELTDLTAAYKKAGLGGFTGFAKSQLGLASSDAAKLYEASASPVRQAIGVILEGGKLAEGDIKRYLDMMPKPGDSDAVADQKLQSLSRVLGRIKDAKIKTFGQAGFDVGTMAPAAAQPVSNLKKQTEDALDALEKAKREGKSPEEIGKLDAEAKRLFDLYQQSNKGA